MKKYLLPNIIKMIIINYMNNKVIYNYNDTNHQKNALLSYITLPFKKEYHFHTNFFEAQSWAKILLEMGYNVDIINFDNNKNINLAKYDLICGFGEAFQKYFEGNFNKNIVTIYYGAGRHLYYNNQATMQRILDVYNKKKVWLAKSSRFLEKSWPHQTTLVDGIIALGNEVCAESYRKNYSKKVYSLNASFFQTTDAKNIISNRGMDTKKSFLWFGSSGLIHKGLDLILDIFSKRNDINLHICGPINNEKDFVSIYKSELFTRENIHTHGFIDIYSEKFKDILCSCSFVINPSCSEGGSPSVLTAIGNGGLIPIITKESTLSTGYEIWIENLTAESVEKSINKALLLSEEVIRKMQFKNLQYVLENHSQEIYYKNLKKSIKSIIAAKNHL